MALSDSSGNQLIILAAKIKYDDHFLFHNFLRSEVFYTMKYAQNFSVILRRESAKCKYNYIKAQDTCQSVLTPFS